MTDTGRNFWKFFCCDEFCRQKAGVTQTQRRRGCTILPPSQEAQELTAGCAEYAEGQGRASLGATARRAPASSNFGGAVEDDRCGEPTPCPSQEGNWRGRPRLRRSSARQAGGGAHGPSIIYWGHKPCDSVTYSENILRFFCGMKFAAKRQEAQVLHSKECQGIGGATEG